MTMPGSEWTIEFYTDMRGNSPPFEFVNRLQAKERAKVRQYLQLLREFGTGIKPPQAKPVTGHQPLWELRPLSYRLLYFAHTGRRFIILHAFRKKGQKLKQEDIKIAEHRRADFLEREG